MYLGEVRDAATLRDHIQANIHRAFSHLDNPALHDNQDETYMDGEEEHDELPRKVTVSFFIEDT